MSDRRPRPRVIGRGGLVTPALSVRRSNYLFDPHLGYRPPSDWERELSDTLHRFVERQTAQLERDCFEALNLQDPNHVGALRVIYHHGYTDPPIPPAVASKWCINDTNGDGDCGNRWGCPSCRWQVDR